uniref:Pyridoxal-dependent decarboxylase domain-containing protein 1 n=1 Tax=Heterorhabditis bacteriophora TaxID=37862 RepID=A0A1I7XCZ7_HETBA
MASEVAAAIQHVEALITNIDSKLDSPSQHSPGSNSSSTKSQDSGLDDPSIKGSSVKSLSRRASRMSQTGVSSVLEQLEHMIVSDEWVGREETPHGHPQLIKTRSREGQRLSDLGRTLITSSSLKSYIDLLSSHHRQSIAAWLYGNTCQALNQQFRLTEANVYCSEPESTLVLSVRKGIGYTVKLALKNAYGADYLTKGWKIFAEKGAPVVYVSPALHMDLAPFLTAEYGISDVVTLPKLEGDLSEVEGRIDHQAFEQMLSDDLAAGRQPLMVVGVVGSTILGQNDMVSKLLETRKNKHRFWLHIVGQAVAALTLREPTEVLVHVLTQVDSLTLPLALWLGIPAAPVITLYRTVEGHKPTYREKLDSLPWWVATQYLTSKRITDIIENAYLLSKVMLKGLSAYPQIEIVGMENPIEFAGRVYKNQYTAPTVLIFKYRYSAMIEAVQNVKELTQKSDEDKAISEEEKNLQNELEYADSLNSWVGYAIYIIASVISHRYNYKFSFQIFALASHVDHVQRFIRLLGDILNIADSTVMARKNFAKLKEDFPSLTLLPVQKWAGVGAVCYIPSMISEKDPHVWNDKEKQQISHMNLELVHQLRSVDSAFSAGESSNYEVGLPKLMMEAPYVYEAIMSVACVKFGMLSDAKDLVNLLKMVAEKGTEIETNQQQCLQYLESLANMIKQGIEAANEDLKKENDLRLQQEGVIRQLPIMGSLVNWWSPIDKETQNIRGRFFNLKTGEIQTTDVLYKHKKGDQYEKTPITPIDTPQNPHDFSKNEVKAEDKDERTVDSPTRDINTKKNMEKK